MHTNIRIILFTYFNFISHYFPNGKVLKCFCVIGLKRTRLDKTSDWVTNLLLMKFKVFSDHRSRFWYYKLWYWWVPFVWNITIRHAYIGNFMSQVARNNIRWQKLLDISSVNCIVKNICKILSKPQLNLNSTLHYLKWVWHENNFGPPTTNKMPAIS